MEKLNAGGLLKTTGFEIPNKIFSIGMSMVKLMRPKTTPNKV